MLCVCAYILYKSLERVRAHTSVDCREGTRDSIKVQVLPLIPVGSLYEMTVISGAFMENWNRY